MEISKIRTDGGTQIRSNIDYDIVEEYRDAMLNGAIFPPVTVFNDGTNYWLADGFHRIYAAKDAEIKEIDVTEKEGTKRDAILFAASANSEHGIRRTNEDKRQAVLTLLADIECVKWSDRQIAKWCRVSHEFVRRIRAQLGVSVNVDRYGSQENPNPTERKVKRGGTVYTQKTDNIGKKPVINQPKTQPEEQTQDNSAKQPPEPKTIDISYYSDIIMMAIFEIDEVWALDELRKKTIGFFNYKLNQIKKEQNEKKN